MHDCDFPDAAVDEYETAALVGKYSGVEHERYQGYGDSEGIAEGTAFWAEDLVGKGEIFYLELMPLGMVNSGLCGGRMVGSGSERGD